ncbi:hypothetical protein [Roseimicrobium sp. ORNL1]|uniref:hypothetical protein n=1 Tax=Roseimicrobium sp. ORNL1 TaxID=2711231 RepID=UPI0013E1CCA3|nr:hypothetical protein [Roseimicrobium sp. ORNL1]QIF01158.1 hypothetical protein G5S37_06370 [Roseimicrobium sp. ORNL1]
MGSTSTKIAALFLFAIAAAGHSHATEHPLVQLEGLGLRFEVKVSQSAKVEPATSSEPYPTLKIESAGDEEDVVVQAKGKSGKVLWSQSFGYNSSAANHVSVQSSTTLDAVIVHHHGYKWDWTRVLLLVARTKEKTGDVKVTPYQPDALLKTLEKHRQFRAGTKYIIAPLGFSGDRVKFECIPIAPDGAAHPFNQDHTQWFTIEAELDAHRNVIPVRVVPAVEANSEDQNK